MPTTTSPLTPTTHRLRVAASFNLRSDRTRSWVASRWCSTDKDFEQMMQMLTGFFVTQIAGAVATFSIADHLAKEPATTQQIATTEGIHSAALSRVAPSEVPRATGLLRQFLRASFDQHERLLVPLEEELAVVRAYLDIESLRLGDLVL